MKTVFIFDVDGTLTDARRPIDIDFHEFMLDFMCKHHCVIVTGSDRPKTLEQYGGYRQTWNILREQYR